MIEKKRILMIGTSHHFQQDVKNQYAVAFKECLIRLMGNRRIQIILEEWDTTGREESDPGRRSPSIASKLASDELRWIDVGTPNLPEYKTYNGCLDYGFDPCNAPPPNPVSVPIYSFDVHEKREKYMVERIVQYMDDCERGLFIAGAAHLHSGIHKLRAAGFDVEAGMWFPNCRR